MRDGIFVSQVHNRGPAVESGKVHVGQYLLICESGTVWCILGGGGVGGVEIVGTSENILN